MRKLFVILFIFASCIHISAQPAVAVNDRLEAIHEVPVFKNPPTQVLAVITDPGNIIDRLQPTTHITVIELLEINAILRIDLWIKIQYINPFTETMITGWALYGNTKKAKNFIIIQRGE